MSQNPPPEIPGHTYQRALGSGGYSDVFEYLQDVTKQPVAVKVLKVESVGDAALRGAFEAEASTMARLDHPFIVKVFSVGVADGGRPYLVLQFYPPPNLGERVRTSPLSVPDLLRTGVQLASAVETAHRARILHRDIKPANILISSYGTPALTDFGIAGSILDQSEEDVGVSIHYSPPEVLSGTSNGSVRADLYSLAATLWALLVGRSPFEVPGGDNSQRSLVARALTAPVPPTGRGDIPAALERLLQQAMSKDPARRPSSALEFARALQSIETQERFGRTQITMLGEPHAGSATPAVSPAPQRFAPESNATRGKPQQVEAQSPPMSPPAAPPAPAASDVAPATAVRPPISRDSQRSLGSAGRLSQRRPTDRPAPPTTDPLPGTVMRPQTTGSQEPEEVPTPVKRSARPKQLAALGAGLVAAAVVVGVVLANGGGSTGAKASGQPTVVAPANDPQPQAPAVAAKRLVDGEARFTWNYPPGSIPNDTFLFRVTDAAGHPLTNSETSAVSPLELRVTPGSKLCIQVTVRRPGEGLGPWSTAECVG